MSTGMGKVVCVTGASGYTVSWLVKLLLDRGHPRKVEHLMTAIKGAQERLHLFEANLTEEGSFDSAIDGCEGVFHTATPVFLSVADPQAELIEPAVKGTLNVLRNPLKPDVVVDETWFSDTVFCEETKQWYAISKTLTEEAARKFADENNIDLVTLHPGFIIGPLLQPTLNLTSESVVNLIKEGREDWPNRYVDVRDVARGLVHIF
ncbi:unnamed protein product [Fraxinus pennsylvanica]|uniref:NAD-dependent epimerase/dehydratase domain-containing protein n=1 Tax=Fraxinus pennsylvanica TaxID=56036 RepID=A0AAD2DS14_9LAMI|nr:unnamed protein product [Fraxinus pennsylvanica]